MNLIIFGDSITWGAWDREGGWVARLRKYCDELTISSQFSRYHSIYNLGISGDTSRELLSRFDSELTPRLDLSEFNIALIAVGTNDSQRSNNDSLCEVPANEFSNNLQTMISIAERYGVRIVLLGLFPVDQSKVSPIPWRLSHSYLNEEIEKYDDRLKKTAQACNVDFIDVYDVISRNNYDNLLIDGVHPNDEGHSLLFEMVKDYFISTGLL